MSFEPCGSMPETFGLIEAVLASIPPPSNTKQNEFFAIRSIIKIIFIAFCVVFVIFLSLIFPPAIFIPHRNENVKS